MLFDLVFLAGPFVIGFFLAAHAIREQDARFWMAAFTYFAYCVFYLAGGREVLIYLTDTYIASHALLM